jgi:thiamine-monophosphate kinase
MVEGTHFFRERQDGRSLGERIAAVNLSDIAAMGGQPRWAVSSIVLPSDVEPKWLREVYQGLDAGLSRHGARVVGGNTAAGPALVFDLTLIGDIETGRALRRTGARPTDLVCVTGTLGDAAAGLAILSREPSCAPQEFRDLVVRRHLAPTPRIDVGRWLCASGAVGACMDVSDGLAGDALHLCRASGVAIHLDLSLLPISLAARAVAQALGSEVEAWATGGGEDYELLFTLKAQRVDLLPRLSQELGQKVTVIGSVEKGPPAVHWHRNGQSAAIEARGFTHF